MDQMITSNDGLISITLTLFMLSLITERVSNFIKLYFPGTFGRTGHDKVSEERRERNIILMSMFVGIVIAFLCRADFFNMIKSDGAVLADMSFNQFTVGNVIGCLVSGLFLSQGSKFFHDLLDVLLYYKNVKKTLVNKQEIENTLLASGKSLNADEFIAAVRAEDRQDDPENHL